MSSQASVQVPKPAERLLRFLRKPWKGKTASIFSRWVRMFPGLPLATRLPFGGWWLARNDFIGSAMFSHGFENAERLFVERLLVPGMIVLDIGAHHGFYTLLASKKVGSHGKVLAIEPSPREMRALRLNLRINRCRNVCVDSRALGEAAGEAKLHIVIGRETGCNSLRKPGSEPTKDIRVHVERLDRLLKDHRIERVDFVKLDVEGAELSVLKGASDLLRLFLRPVILAEVQDIRTKPWGYPAREIVRFLVDLGYDWFDILPDGRLEAMHGERELYHGNFVAIPVEHVKFLAGLTVGNG